MTRLQTGVDQAHRHLVDNEPEAAQQTLARQLSEDHYPLGNGLENTVTSPILYPPVISTIICFQFFEILILILPNFKRSPINFSLFRFI